jgi:biotin transport system substrate-specific component
MNVKVQSIAQPSEAAKNAALIVAASFFVAICAHISVPIPFTPVPFSMQNLAVLLVGLALGPTRGFAALALYLAEGAAGLPFFAPGPGGIAQIIGPTGGYLMAYPFIAYIAGAIFVRVKARQRFLVALAASTVAEVVLFLAGTVWLTVYTHSFLKAALLGIAPFLPVEAMKIALASLGATRFNNHE